MTNLERVNKFRLEEIAVNCETEEEAKAFVKWCFDNGMGWKCHTEDTTSFDNFKNETCYDFDLCYSEQLKYANKKFYDRNGYEIVKYQDFMKEEKKMNNLEYYISKGLINIGNALCGCAHIIKYGGRCNDKGCDECEFNKDIDLCVKTLLEEHKEPIKLKQWEYDLIETNDKPHDYRFEDFKTYQHMLGKGHFKGVVDTSMTLQEILDNCEIVADDYDFWGVKEDK